MNNNINNLNRVNGYNPQLNNNQNPQFNNTHQGNNLVNNQQNMYNRYNEYDPQLNSNQNAHNEYNPYQNNNPYTHQGNNVVNNQQYQLYLAQQSQQYQLSLDNLYEKYQQYQQHQQYQQYQLSRNNISSISVENLHHKYHESLNEIYQNYYQSLNNLYQKSSLSQQSVENLFQKYHQSLNNLCQQYHQHIQNLCQKQEWAEEQAKKITNAFNEAIPILEQKNNLDSVDNAIKLANQIAAKNIKCVAIDIDNTLMHTDSLIKKHNNIIEKYKEDNEYWDFLITNLKKPNEFKSKISANNWLNKTIETNEDNIFYDPVFIKTLLKELKSRDINAVLCTASSGTYPKEIQSLLDGIEIIRVDHKSEKKQLKYDAISKLFPNSKPEEFLMVDDQSQNFSKFKNVIKVNPEIGFTGENLKISSAHAEFLERIEGVDMLFINDNAILNKFQNNSPLSSQDIQNELIKNGSDSALFYDVNFLYEILDDSPFEIKLVVPNNAGDDYCEQMSNIGVTIIKENEIKMRKNNRKIGWVVNGITLKEEMKNIPQDVDFIVMTPDGFSGGGHVLRKEGNHWIPVK